MGVCLRRLYVGMSGGDGIYLCVGELGCDGLLWEVFLMCVP